MKSDFSQPFEIEPTHFYLLVQHPRTGEFVLLKSLNEYEKGWHEVLALDLDESQPSRLSQELAIFLSANLLILENYRELYRQTNLAYSFADDTPGTQRAEVCLLVSADPKTPFDLKADESTGVFVPLEQVEAALSNGPFVSPTVIAGITILKNEST